MNVLHSHFQCIMSQIDEVESPHTIFISKSDKMPREWDYMWILLQICH